MFSPSPPRSQTPQDTNRASETDTHSLGEKNSSQVRCARAHICDLYKVLWNPALRSSGGGGHAPLFTLDRKWQGLRLGRLCGLGASALTRCPGRHWEWPVGGELGARRRVCLLGSVWVGESLGPYVLLLRWPRLGRSQSGLARSFPVVMPGECILGTHGSPTRCESCQDPWARSVPLGPPPRLCWSPLKASLTKETRSPWCSGFLKGGARPAPRHVGSTPSFGAPRRLVGFGTVF